jgi:putative intracellular protease/amidase
LQQGLEGEEKIMANKLPCKALIAVSSFNGAIYPGGHKTGVFFVEALHPYEVLTAAGFAVDLASETGTFGFDDVSLTPPFLSGSDHGVLNARREGHQPCERCSATERGVKLLDNLELP